MAVGLTRVTCHSVDGGSLKSWMVTSVEGWSKGRCAVAPGLHAGG